MRGATVKTAARILLAFVALVFFAYALGILLDCADTTSGNPIERVVATVRVYEAGENGTLRVGGLIDSVTYFPTGTPAARRDSAQFWVYVDGTTTTWQADTTGGSAVAYRELDANGDGSLEWIGRVEGFGLYREAWPQDGMLRGQQQAPLFFDDGAFVRAAYAAGVLVSVTAWGTETIIHPGSDSTTWRRDVGAELVQSSVDSTQFFFTGGLRTGGGRYVVRTLSVWMVGANRWMRLEVVRDTLAFAALVP